VKRSICRCPGVSDQSSQLSSLSWQYALLLPPGAQHRRRRQHRTRNQEQRDRVARALPAELEYRGVVGGALHTRVPAEVVVAPIAVVLGVRLVVLAVVAHEVPEREAVVTGDEVHAVRGCLAGRSEEITATREPGRDLAEEPWLAA
jgi:hypothetical protein